MRGFRRDQAFDHLVQPLNVVPGWTDVELDEPDFQRFAKDVAGRSISSKLLEAYIALTLLQPDEKAVLLDASGPTSMFLPWANMWTNCRSLFLLDSKVHLRPSYPKCVTPLEGFADQIPLECEEVTMVSLLRGLRYLWGDRDIGFIREVARVLRPGGKAVILPVVLGTTYSEVWSSPILTTPKFDGRAQTLACPGATILGTEDFARIYDSEAFTRRILRTAQEENLTWKLLEYRLNGNDVPEYTKASPRLHRPLRVLLLEK